MITHLLAVHLAAPGKTTDTPGTRLLAGAFIVIAVLYVISRIRKRFSRKGKS